ncbi:tyrosine-type recombinase/integrase [Amycolatopsis viridis]|uniref:Integrase n=1 Tax=Amycolatopsis viridis TaxID=185678 RepID=A0ABX0T2C4_9PSEU|nr:site-specific integrase [Amycolatopsis viridis]NIH81710.1 integrase [Amycolatopsis viridis]
MGYTKDLWTRPEEQPDGKVKRVPNARWGKGKRWLACWLDPDGNERTKAFATKTPADKYWRDMESARDRGEYHDPKAGRKLFGDLAQAWFEALAVDPATRIRTEQVLRLHVLPTFGKRQLKAIQPSEINTFLAKLSETHEWATRAKALGILQGVLDLAEADNLVKKNVAKSKVIQRVKPTFEKVEAWSDERVFALIDAHPDEYRLFPIIAATCGLRAGELFGLALEDIDFEDQVIHVRRQLKRIGKHHVFALPKNDQERDVPLANWTAENIRLHVEKYRPRPCSLPWEKPDGPLRAHNILFRWHDGGFVKDRNFSEEVWKPAAHAAGIIGPPVPKQRGQLRYNTTGKEGPHQLRHYYASVTLADGVNIKELAEYLGHHDPSFTLKQYAHMLPDSHDRAREAVDRRMFRPRLVAGGT